MVRLVALYKKRFILNKWNNLKNKSFSFNLLIVKNVIKYIYLKMFSNVQHLGTKYSLV